jgi:hypothetical protein
MSFASQLAEYSAAEIIAATGCPRGTAYDWKDGRREPPAWQQPHWLAIIARRTRKMHNKTLMPTDTSRAAGSRKRKS